MLNLGHDPIQQPDSRILQKLLLISLRLQVRHEILSTLYHVAEHCDLRKLQGLEIGILIGDFTSI